jgi:hypothetical protein
MRLLGRLTFVHQPRQPGAPLACDAPFYTVHGVTASGMTASGVTGNSRRRLALSRGEQPLDKIINVLDPEHPARDANR